MKTFTQEQQDFIVEARKEFVEVSVMIDQHKNTIKDIFEALFDRLGVDTKEDKDTVKALKKGFQIYYKETQDEEERVSQGAITVAGMQ